jgi:hypothetical protein
MTKFCLMKRTFIIATWNYNSGNSWDRGASECVDPVIYELNAPFEHPYFVENVRLVVGLPFSSSLPSYRTKFRTELIFIHLGHNLKLHSSWCVVP